MEQPTQLEADAWEIRKRAEDRLGELSATLDKSAGGHNPKATLPIGGKSKSKVLADAGIQSEADVLELVKAELGEDSAKALAKALAAPMPEPEVIEPEPEQPLIDASRTPGDTIN